MMGNRECESSVAGLLERHFEVAFSAPEGVKKLRELILTLAMKGTLVPQNPNDQPASELLKEIEVEKQRLVKEGKIKPPKSLPPVRQDEVPYELPSGWEWVRLGVLTSYNFGKTPASKNPVYWSDNDGYHWASIADMPTRGYLEETTKRVTQLAISDVFKYEPAPVGSLLMSFKLSIGKAAITKIATYHNEAIISFVNLDQQLKMYLFWILFEVANSGNTKGAIKGSTLNSESISELLIPLPPLAEQQRIVARIDELMARCDALETLRAEREEKRVAVHAAAIKQLLDTQDADASAKAWRFISRNFGELYAVKENVAELRKAILQLAVMGKLVPQDPNDQPASELLKEIEAEKQRLVKAGKIKKQKPLPPINPDEVPYDLPKGWEWVRLGEAISYMDAGWSPKCETRPASDSEWGVLKTTAVQRLEFLPHENKSLPIKLTPRPEYQVEEKDILITRAGPKNRVGICCVATSVRPKLMLSDKIIRFKIYGDLIFPNYCALSLSTGYCVEQIESYKSGMAESQMNISQEKVKRLLLPLPPLPEQHRIVARVDELMILCDTLESQLNAKKEKQTELLYSIMV